MITKEIQDMMESSDIEMVTLGLNIAYSRGISFSELEIKCKHKIILDGDRIEVVMDYLDFGLVDLWGMTRTITTPFLDIITTEITYDYPITFEDSTSYTFQYPTNDK
jgi:hypothetical protein